jgi:hypothetical protein
VADNVVRRVGQPVVIEPSARQNPVTHRHFDVTNRLRAFPDVHCRPIEDGLAAMLAAMRLEASG